MINNISSNCSKVQKINLYNLKFSWFDYIDIYLQVVVVVVVIAVDELLVDEFEVF